ncbi:MAG TPA: hypothetical protein VJQ52_16425 [Steroidobacteraceae bacterium]|nr:hypothetical protein [Steroidobacteraceae bacterium]
MSGDSESGFVRDRRRVLAALTALLGLAGLASSRLIAGRKTEASSDDLARTLMDALQLDEHSMARMCTARGRSQLVSHMSGCGEQIAQLQQRIDAASLKRVVRQQIEIDYSRGAIVDVDGWQLAATEALVIAICARVA